MKRLYWLLFVLAFIACGQTDENASPVTTSKLILTNDVLTLTDYGHMGVDIRIDNMDVTRSGASGMYALTVSKPDRIKELNFLMLVEAAVDGGYRVSVFADDDDMEFLGALVYDENDHMIDVVTTPETRGRKEGECFKDCVKREYNEKKEALEKRPLDDVACAWTAGLCETLLLISAAYDCC